MTAVSCRATAWIVELLERSERDVDAWVRNLPIRVEQLRDPTQRVDWDVFSVLCDRLQIAFDGIDPLVEAAGAFASESFARRDAQALQGLGGGFNDARQLYWLAREWLVPAIFPPLVSDFVELADGRLCHRLEVPAELRPCPPLLRLIACVLEQVPRLIGAEPAELEVSYTDRGAVYTIGLPAARPAVADAPPVVSGEPVPSESEARCRAITESSRDIISEVDAELNVLSVTENVQSLIGIPAHLLRGRDPVEVVHPDDIDDAEAQLRELLRTGGTAQLLLRVRNVDGSWHSLETTATGFQTPEGVKRCVLISRDMTSQRETEDALRGSREELLQSQKMEAVGRLAGGIAHDFNNLLTAITGYGDLLIDELGPAHPLRADAQEILRAAERASGLTRQLLAFSRRQVLQPRLLDLNAVASDVDQLLRRLIGEDVELVTSLEGEIPAIRVDPGQLQQLILNLAVNARDAMPQGGHLTLETGRVTLTDSGQPGAPRLAPGEYVTLAVTDTGVGMDDATLARIFEPFFTTKALGKGTGLGLSTAYGIVQQSGGDLRVESTLGKGSRFEVYLPAIERAEELTEQIAVKGSMTGDETILLVEDAEPVRHLVRRYLEKHGYTVLEAASGVEALRCARRAAGEIDLLLTDVVLPKLGGPALAQRLTAANPQLPVVYMSGFVDDTLASHGVIDADVVLVQKPFSPLALIRTVREVLDAPRGRRVRTEAAGRDSEPLARPNPPPARPK